jgi:hypothetical protein
MNVDVDGETLGRIDSCGAIGARFELEAITSGYSIVFELDLFTKTYTKMSVTFGIQYKTLVY